MIIFLAVFWFKFVVETRLDLNLLSARARLIANKFSFRIQFRVFE